MSRQREQDTAGQDRQTSARTAYERHAWDDAYVAYAALDAERPLSFEDLERFAMAASLSGHDSEFFATMERLYHGYCAADRCGNAARTAFWMAMRLLPMGEVARAGAWLERARRLAEGLGEDSAEAGYLSIPAAQRALTSGDMEATIRAASRAVALGERHGEADIVALGRVLLGRARLRRGEVERGLAELDEAMLSATGGELSPAYTGVVYCQVIVTYQQIFALDRARQWTRALETFCNAQPQLVPFTGSCLVHRAEILELGGEWQEAREAVESCTQRPRSFGGGEAQGEAFYRKGEIERLRGDLAAAERSYEAAAERGREPLPGLALLRLVQGEPERALAALRRVLSTLTDSLARVPHLVALLEAAVAAGQMDLAREACEELRATADKVDTRILQAISAEAMGVCALAAGDVESALPALRRAFSAWHALEAPYPSARLRVRIARACDQLGDADGARLERAAARRVFESLGATIDLAALDLGAPPAIAAPRPPAATAIAAPRPPAATATAAGVPLSPRELEVLRWVATGATNRAIAEELCLSEKTIDRHVSNIFDKLDVRTRAAATAYAFAHGLVRPDDA